MFAGTSVTVRDNHAAETKGAPGRQYHEAKLEWFVSHGKIVIFGLGKALEACVFRLGYKLCCCNGPQIIFSHNTEVDFPHV